MHHCGVTEKCSCLQHYWEVAQDGVARASQCRIKVAGNRGHRPLTDTANYSLGMKPAPCTCMLPQLPPALSTAKKCPSLRDFNHWADSFNIFYQ